MVFFSLCFRREKFFRARRFTTPHNLLKCGGEEGPLGPLTESTIFIPFILNAITRVSVLRGGFSVVAFDLFMCIIYSYTGRVLKYSFKCKLK